MAQILIVEDDGDLREGMRLTLERWGHFVCEAEDAASGIRQFCQSAIDVAVVDLILPGMEGLELIKCLQRAQPSLKIIAISGAQMGPVNQYLKMARHLGAAKSLAKPFADDALVEAVGEVLNQKGEPNQGGDKAPAA